MKSRLCALVCVVGSSGVSLAVPVPHEMAVLDDVVREALVSARPEGT